MKVKVNELAAAVELELDEYGEEVSEGVRKVVSRVASQLVRRLKQTSPRRTGRYAKSWTKTETKPPKAPAATVYNKDYGWRTHLVENGHSKADGGRVEGFPHIAPAEEEAEQTLVADVESLLREVSS